MKLVSSWLLFNDSSIDGKVSLRAPTDVNTIYFISIYFYIWNREAMELATLSRNLILAHLNENRLSSKLEIPNCSQCPEKMNKNKIKK